MKYWFTEFDHFNDGFHQKPAFPVKNTDKFLKSILLKMLASERLSYIPVPKRGWQSFVLPKLVDPPWIPTHVVIRPYQDRHASKKNPFRKPKIARKILRKSREKAALETLKKLVRRFQVH